MGEARTSRLRPVAKKAGRYVKGFLATCGLLAVPGAVAVLALDFVTDAWRVTALKGFLVVCAAFFPGWLFVQFVRNRFDVVWEEFVLNLHRLGIDKRVALPSPPGRSIYAPKQGEVCPPEDETIYKHKFEAYYGKRVRDDQRPRKRDGGSIPLQGYVPVCLATLVFAVGWASLVAGDALEKEPTTELATALRFGFLGAYAFSVQVFIRRFFQDDLKAGAYISATIRVLLAVVAAALFHVLPQTEGMRPGWHAAFAFAVGYVPSALVLLAEQLWNRLLAHTGAATFRVRYPLGEIDGLDAWCEVRLLEEGIEDMQNLATANLVDVLLRTRVPATRLVDWVDQAILFTHLLPEGEGGGDQRRRFRQVGIRTATDLLAVVNPPPGAKYRLPPDDCERLLHWAVFGADPRPEVKLVAAYVNSLRSDTNLYHVERWRDAWWEEPDGTGVPVSANGAGGANGARRNRLLKWGARQTDG